MLKGRLEMRRFFFELFLIVSCATGAVAGPIEEANPAYENGDYALAARLLRPFAEREDLRAQSNLGRFYYMGQEVPKDTRDAVKEWRRAAAQGDKEAPLNLGSMYEKGQGAPQDNVLAYMWYAVAAAVLSGEDAKVAKKLQDHVATRMTAAQIKTAQAMAKQCHQSKFKDCD